MITLYRWLNPTHFRGITLWLLIRPTEFVLVLAFAYSYLLLMHVGRFDPVVAWAAWAWRDGRYATALFRVRLFSWRDRRAPFLAFLLTSANLADEAYMLATGANLPYTDMEEPTYHPAFAAGRAALAQGNLVQARYHFDRLYERFPGSALARSALGDLLLWQGVELDRAHHLLTAALADSDRKCLPHWNQLGFESELRASHAWSMAVMQQDFQNDLDLATRLAGQNKPVSAAAHLRLGYALRAVKHFITAREHWRLAHEIDPHGWAGVRAGLELASVVQEVHLD